RWCMIELIRPHRLDQTEIVNVLLDVRKTVGDPLSTLPGLMKRVLRSEQLGHAADERETFAGQERSGTILPIKPLQFWFMFKQLEWAGRPRHVQINHATYFRWELRGKRRKGSSGIAVEIKGGGFCSCRFGGWRKLGDQRSQEHRTQASAQAAKEVSPCSRLQVCQVNFTGRSRPDFQIVWDSGPGFGIMHRNYLVRVASRLIA